MQLLEMIKSGRRGFDGRGGQVRGGTRRTSSTRSSSKAGPAVAAVRLRQAAFLWRAEATTGAEATCMKS